jgi:hypothetical protein
MGISLIPELKGLGIMVSSSMLFAAAAASRLDHLKRLFNAKRSRRLAGRIFPERLQELPHDGRTDARIRAARDVGCTRCRWS